MASYTKGTLSREMLQSSSDLSNIVSHRKGNSFREFVHRQVDEARISIVATNFGSIQRDSSLVTQPTIASDKEDSLHVTPSGEIIQQDREKGSFRPSLYDEDRFIGDEEELTEDGTESSTETREYVEGRVEDGGETLEGDGEGRTGDGGEKEENVKDEPKAEEGEEGKEDGSGEKPGNEEEGASGEERETDNSGENVEDGGAIPEDGRRENVEEGDRAFDVEEKAGDEQEKIGDGEDVVDNEQGQLVDEGEKSEEGQDKGEISEEEQDKGEISDEGQDKGEQPEKGQDKEEGDETKEEESGVTQSEEGAQQKESGDVEQESREKDEEKEQMENEEEKKLRIGGEDEKAGEEEDKDEEKEDELVQEIMTRAIQSARTDDVVSFGLGSADIGLKGESVSSSFEHEKLTERLKQINFELSYVNRKNRFLTKAVVDIRGKKADIDTGDSKLTEGYLKKLVHFEKIKFSIQNEMKKIADQVESLRESSKSAGEMYDAAQEDFLQKVADAYKRLDSNFGSSASEKTIIQPTPRIQTALANVSKMRLKMIKLQNHLAEKEAQLKSLDDRGGGLHLIDYEKLKMHNQHLIETIAERDLELLRLRKKIETDTQKLAHVRERAKIVGEENRDYHATLEELDTQIKLASNN
ncbi:coiled-coil domain-containing protein 96 isoform X2 [Nilaparvata lugens]|uniref:coiled-coil domain-containing protein 96 isoform X2 n=1 Tax=Nilaparvata lugens TaxID=108931 RepID=UPI00193D7DF1|nr:coiled-coil domain-containing protein 96 isoform X2 [Nilaparvata lugens]